MICAVIGQHPDAFGLPEVNLFRTPSVGALIDFKPQVFGKDASTAGLRRAVAELMHEEQTVETIDQAAAWIAQRAHLTGGEMFHELIAMAGRRLMVDKSPTNSHADSLERVYAAFPNAYYLHIARHPRATCKSQHKAFSGKTRFEKHDFDHERQWFKRHQNCLSFGQRLDPGQYMFLHGEWFFEDPPLVLRQICEWLDLSTDPEAIDMMMHPENGPFSCFGPENAHGGNNKGFLESPHLRVGKIKESTLDGPFEWITGEDVEFDMKTRNFAHQLGYRG